MSHSIEDDVDSVAEILNWAFYYKREKIIEDLWYIFRERLVQYRYPILEARMSLMKIRSRAVRLNLEDPEFISNLLTLLNQFEENHLTSEHHKNEWASSKREVILQGALSILQSHLFPNGAPTLNSEADITVPTSFNSNSYSRLIENYFQENRRSFLTEEDRLEHKRSFLDDIITSKKGKKLLSKSKVYYLFVNNSWERQKKDFLTFLDRFESKAFPIPVLHQRGNSNNLKQESNLDTAQDLIEEDWDDELAQQKGPYATDTLPESSFSSPQKFQHHEQNQPPQNGQHLAELRKLQKKYDHQDPLPAALEHSESMRLFTSVSEAAKKRQRHEPSSSAAYLGYEEPEQIKNLAQLTEGEERTDSEDDRILAALETLKKSSEGVSKKRKLSVPDHLAASPIASIAGKVTKRLKWTSEEQLAIEEGVKKYGNGNWIAIKEDPEFGPALSRRTNVNLKDRWRVMLKYGWDGNGYTGNNQSF